MDNAKHAQSHQDKLSTQKISTDGGHGSTTANGATNVVFSGSAKANSRSINAIHRQINNKQSNRHGSQIILSHSQQKTPIAAQMSTGVTTGSQKHLQLKEQNPMTKQPVIKSQMSNKQDPLSLLPASQNMLQTQHHASTLNLTQASA